MRGLSKKMLISILTSVVVFVTMIATTFAWVGIFTYASAENIKLNLKTVELDSSYFLTISATGDKNSFSDEVKAVDLKRQILNNRFNNMYEDSSNEAIESIYNRYNVFSPVSPIIEDDRIKSFEKIDLNNTTTMNMLDTKEFLKFDLFLSVNTKEGISSITDGINSNVYLSEIDKTLTGSKGIFSFVNDNPFMELPSSPINDSLKLIPRTFNVDSKNATRFALEIYDPINVNDIYSGDENPVKTLIYQGGNQNPSYNEITDVYDLGGCLPEEQNSALIELLYIRSGYKFYTEDLYNQKLNAAVNRTDLELIDDNSKIWDKSIDGTQYLGCMNGIQTKMKITVYFWFEGWDSDCLAGIYDKFVSLSLAFTPGVVD